MLSDQDKARRAATLAKLRNKYPQRIISDVTPDYLMDLYSNHMTIEGDKDIAPYIGKWFLLSGPLYNEWKSATSTNVTLRANARCDSHTCLLTTHGAIAYLL